MKKTIIVFSNPFGYGPTGNAIPILEAFLSLDKVDIIFAGSGLCLEILPKNKYKICIVDERNESAIQSFLETIENPYVIGVQNRFCIKVCKKMNIPCAFVDVLSWFWKKIPEDHLIADEIFWIKFMGIENRQEYNGNVHIISGIVESPSTMHKKGINSKRLVIHIGGAKYPVVGGIPKNYLRLISFSLNVLAKKNIYDEIVFVSGSESINYLKAFKIDGRIKVDTFSRSEYLLRLKGSDHMMTTAGVSSTIESFYFGVPVSFILPINLSQLALTDFLSSQNFQFQKMDWGNYVSVNPKIKDMTEKEGILEIEDYSQKILNSKDCLDKYVSDFVGIANNIPNTKDQKKIIDYIGSSGASDVLKVLSKKWDLT